MPSLLMTGVGAAESLPRLALSFDGSTAYLSKAAPASQFQVGGDSCAALDGSTQWFTIPDSSLWAPGSSSASWAIWYYPTSFAAQAVLFSQYESGFNKRSWEFVVSPTTGQANFWVSINGTGATTPSTGNLTLNSWNLLVGRIDSVNQKVGISLNGGAFSELAFTGPLYDSDSLIYIGCGVNAGTISYKSIGRLANPLYMKGYCISPTEVTWLYNSANARTYSESSTYFGANLSFHNSLSGGSWTSDVGPNPTAVGSPTTALGITGHKSVDICFWMNAGTNASSAGILGIATSNTAATRAIRCNIPAGGGAYGGQFSDGTSNRAVNNQTVPDGSWSFCRIAHDAVNNVVFSQINNGAKATSAWINGVQALPTAGFEIGGPITGSDSVRPAMKLDSLAIRIGSDVFTDAEVAEMYNAGVGVSSAHLSSGLRARLTEFYDLGDAASVIGAINGISLTPHGSLSVVAGVA